MQSVERIRAQLEVRDEEIRDLEKQISSLNQELANSKKSKDETNLILLEQNLALKKQFQLQLGQELNLNEIVVDPTIFDIDLVQESVAMKHQIEILQDEKKELLVKLTE